RRLLLEGLGQLAVPRLQLLEQPDVLDGDDGLVGERLQQADLCIGEDTGLPPADSDRPDGLAPAKHRDRYEAPITTLPREGPVGRRVRVRQVDDRPLPDGLTRRKRSVPGQVGPTVYISRESVVSAQPDEVPIDLVCGAEESIAQPDRVADDR